MRTITFSGSSDDLVHVDGGPKRLDEINTFEPVYFVVGGKLRVRVAYEENGCWSIGTSQYDEMWEIPDDWIIRIEQCSDVGYSTQLVCEVPDDVTVVKEG